MSWSIEIFREYQESLYPLYAISVPEPRARLKYECTYYPSPNIYPCQNCTGKVENCKFRINNLWKPIPKVWQLEYLTKDEMFRFEYYLNQLRKNNDNNIR